MLSFNFLYFRYVKTDTVIFSDLIIICMGIFFAILNYVLFGAFFLGFRLVDFSFITRRSSMLNFFYENVPVVLHLDYFRVTISAMNICYILEQYRYGCLDSPRDFYCTNNRRETDFTE